MPSGIEGLFFLNPAGNAFPGRGGVAPLQQKEYA